ncbi:MAG: hypothetical protein OXC53_04340 [Rhodobacteraceae bacterium]|nr:hypothetical protein [Paracoccaceae bacterium]
MNDLPFLKERHSEAITQPDQLTPTQGQCYHEELWSVSQTGSDARDKFSDNMTIIICSRRAA